MLEPADLPAVVLAGGFGTRLRSVVADRPKVLAPVHGRPFLAYLLDHLAAAGVRDVVLSTGYLAEQVEAAFGQQYRGLRVSYSHETTALGTAGAIRLAWDAIRAPAILALNGDSFCNAALADLVASHAARDAAGSLVLCRVPDAARFGHVETDADERVTRFEEKGAHVGPGWINAGVYALSARLISSIPLGQCVSLEREMFPRWTGQGLFGRRQEQCRLLDIGTPESYAEAERYFAAGAAP